MDQIREHLSSILVKQGIKIEDDAVELLARTAEGGLRDALSLADMCISYCGDTVTYQDVVSILGTADKQFLFDVCNMLIRRDKGGIINAVTSLIADGRDPGVFLKDLIGHISDLIAVSVAPQSVRFETVSKEHVEKLATQAKQAGDELLLRSLEILEASEGVLRASTRPRIALETALLRICSPNLESDTTAMMDRINYLERELGRLKAGGVVAVKNDNAPSDTASEASKRPQNGVVSERPQIRATQDSVQQASKPASSTEKKTLGTGELWDALIVRLRKSNPLLYSAVKEAAGGVLAGGTYTITFDAGNESKAAFARKKLDVIATELGALVDSKPGVVIECSMQQERNINADDAFRKQAIDLFGEDNIKFT